MSIVPLSKVTLYGPAAEKGAVLDGLQQLGCVHLNDLHSEEWAGVAVDAASSDARAALQFLYDSPVHRRPLERAAGFDLAEVVKEAIDSRDRLHALDAEREQLRQWIADLEPWGDFELPDWAQEGPHRFWFYAIPHHQIKLVQASSVVWSIVGRDHRFCYVVAIAADQPADVPVPPTPLHPESLSKLRARLEQVECELEEIDYRRIGLTLYTDKLRQALDEADDRAAREQAKRATLEQDQVFAVQGWAPAARSAALRGFAADGQLALTIETPSAQDTPPTLLENPSALRGGEALVQFYKIPGYASWDPSAVVFFSFTIFFAMIIADAGYGLLLGLVLVAMWKRLKGTSLRGLLVSLVLASIIYGMLVGIYFGLLPPEGTWLAAVHVLDANNQTLMMMIAIGAGATHIATANLFTAWQHRHSLRALSAVGWACIVAGGFCAGAGKIYTLSWLSGAGYLGLGLGVGLVVLFASEHPFHLAPRELLGRLVHGVKDLTELSRAFGDVLSYLRLFALGLAALKLAEVFNHLAGDAFALKGGWVLLGIFILLVGHTLNLGMGIMSAVVHGLRLNVIEFFNWGLREDGLQFQAFAKRTQK